MKCLIAAILLTLSSSAFAQVTTQPVSTPTSQPATQHARAPKPLTPLISSTVLHIEHMPASADHDATAKTLVDGLVGTRVYGNVTVDSVVADGGETIITAHAPWKDKAVLTAEEQAQVDAAQKESDQQSAHLSRFQAQLRQQSNQFQGDLQSVKNAAKKSADKLDEVKKNTQAAADARVPLQVVTVITDAPAASHVQPKSSYTASGFITSAMQTSDENNMVALMIKVKADQ